MTSKLIKQLQKLFTSQGELDDVEKEKMIETQRAFGLLLHAANIKEYKLSDDIDEVLYLSQSLKV